MKTIQLCCILLFCLALVNTSCKKEDQENLINTNNPNEIGPALLFPAGSFQQTGPPPSPSVSFLAPTVESPLGTITSSNGGTVPFGFTYDNVNGNLGGCYVVVEGLDGVYWNIPYTTNSGSAGSLQLPVGIPTNASEGTFCISFCVYDQQNRVSNIRQVCVEVLRLGTGGLQISLSWGTSSDQDIYVTTPNGDEISYDNPYADGGELDRDDTDGYGPENVFWLKDAPDGYYTVRVHDFSDTTYDNPFYVTINAPGVTRNYSGTTKNGSTVNVITFSKNGSQFVF